MKRLFAEETCGNEKRKMSHGIHKISPASDTRITEGVIKLSDDHGRKHVKEPDTDPLRVYPSEYPNEFT